MRPVVRRPQQVLPVKRMMCGLTDEQKKLKEGVEQVLESLEANGFDPELIKSWKEMAQDQRFLENPIQFTAEMQASQPPVVHVEEPKKPITDFSITKSLLNIQNQVDVAMNLDIMAAWLPHADIHEEFIAGNGIESKYRVLFRQNSDSNQFSTLFWIPPMPLAVWYGCYSSINNDKHKTV